MRLICVLCALYFMHTDVMNVNHFFIDYTLLSTWVALNMGLLWKGMFSIFDCVSFATWTDFRLAHAWVQWLGGSFQSWSSSLRPQSCIPTCSNTVACHCTLPLSHPGCTLICFGSRSYYSLCLTIFDCCSLQCSSLDFTKTLILLVFRRICLIITLDT